MDDSLAQLQTCSLASTLLRFLPPPSAKWAAQMDVLGVVNAILRADSYYTSRFRSLAERHRSVKFCHVYLNRYVNAERNASVKSQFRSVTVAERDCLTGRNGSELAWTSSILIMWTVQRLVQYTSSVCLRRLLPGFSSEIDLKLIELVRKCEELYDMSKKK